MNLCWQNLIRVRTVVLGFVLVLLCTMQAALAATFVVNSTADTADAAAGDGVCDAGGGVCTLRAAIEEANAFAGTDTVNFNIPNTEPGYSAAPLSYTLQLTGALPAITEQIALNASSQPDFPGTPIIVLDGGPPTAPANGLTVNASAGGSTIRGFVIVRYDSNGILLLGGSNLVAGNYVGIGADGTTALANNVSNGAFQGGIRIESGLNTIGGTSSADRNVISGNLQSGLVLFGAAASNNDVFGNFIGTDANGLLPRGNAEEGIDVQLGNSNTIGGATDDHRNLLSGNGSDGIEIDGGDFNVVQGNYIGTDVTGSVIIANGRDGVDINEDLGDGSTNTLVGGTAPGEGNLIRGNTIAGVEIRGAPANDNSVLGNRIFGNVVLDIDLNADGVSANDPGDIDAGSNLTLNHPEIAVAEVSGATLTAYFSLDVPAGDYRVEFFSNPSGAHASGNGGGEVFAGATTVTHAGAGVEFFIASFAGSVGDVITATATEELAGPTYASTSEFSAPITATAFVPYFARWPLDETAGTTAAEIINGNDGTYTNGVLLNQAGACSETNTAVYFDGIDDYVEVPHVPEYLMHQGTAAMWVNLDAVATQQMFFSKDSNGFDTGGHLTIYLTSGGNYEVRLQTPTAHHYATSIAPAVAGNWAHVTATWGPGGLRLYIDAGAPSITPHYGGLGVTSGGIGNFEPIAFGASTINSGDGTVLPLNSYMAGYLDDVRFYNRELSQSEIQVLAACTPNPAVVKRAFWPDGTPIPSGATIPSGVEFNYLLYVNNQDLARSDVSVRDVLDPAFEYQSGSIRVSNSVPECAATACTVVEEQAIFAATAAAPLLTDAIDGDVASYSAGITTIDAGDGNVLNNTLNINADSVWAILFSVKMP